MASNRELRDEAEALALQLKTEVDTKGLNNERLTELVESLRARVAAANEAPTEPPEAQPEIEIEIERTGAPPEEPEPEPSDSPPQMPAPEEGAPDPLRPMDHPAVVGDDEPIGGPPVRQAPLKPIPVTPPVPVEPVNGAAEEVQAQPENDGRYRWPYSVAEGRTIRCARGTLGAFDRVKPTDFAGGQRELDELVKSGHVIKGNTKG